MIIDRQKRLERAQKLHQQTLDAMPVSDAVLHLCQLVAEREQEAAYWEDSAFRNAKAEIRTRSEGFMDEHVPRSWLPPEDNLKASR